MRKANENINTRLDKTDISLLAILYGIAVILNVYEYYNKDYALVEFLVDIPFGVIISVIIIFIFMNVLIPKFLIESRKYIVFIILGLLTLCVFGIMDDLAGNWSSGKSLFLPKWYDAILSGFYTSVNNTGIVFAILLAKKFYEGQAKMATIHNEQKENELKLLRSQIDPHFLFNNLNTLDALVDTKPKVAKKYINSLSSLYRYLIKTKDKEVMGLAEEIDFARDYIFLIETRFGNDYDFQINHSISLDDKFIPTGAIQALLENAVKHNPKEPKKNPIEVRITTDSEWLTVTNTISNAARPTESLGTGLKNLEERYKLMTDKKLIINSSDTQYSIAVPILNIAN